MEKIKLKVHGCRGSTAYDSPDNVIFGGNSTCYSLRTPNNDLIFLDAGTGLVDAQKGYFFDKPNKTYLFISHVHHDHIEGLGVTGLIFIPNLNLDLFGPKGIEDGLRSRYNGMNFPVTLEQMQGIKDIKELQGSLTIGKTLVDILESNHSNIGSLAFSFKIVDKKIVYATDIEFDFFVDSNSDVKPFNGLFKQQYLKFIKDSDILIADAQYLKEEYLEEKPINVKGWGHSYVEQIVDLAYQASVKKVLITHHAPTRTDEQLKEMEIKAQDYSKAKGYNLEIDFARQGVEYIIS